MGAIIGAPLAGVILGSHKRGRNTQLDAQDMALTQKNYNNVVVYDTVLLVAASMCVSYVRWLDAKDKGRWKWKA